MWMSLFIPRCFIYSIKWLPWTLKRSTAFYLILRLHSRSGWCSVVLWELERKLSCQYHCQNDLIFSFTHYKILISCKRSHSYDIHIRGIHSTSNTENALFKFFAYFTNKMQVERFALQTFGVGSVSVSITFQRLVQWQRLIDSHWFAWFNVMLLLSWIKLHTFVKQFIQENMNFANIQQTFTSLEHIYCTLYFYF